MSGEGRPQVELDLSDCASIRLAIVVTRWHPKITDSLLALERTPRSFQEPLRADEGAPGTFGDT